MGIISPQCREATIKAHKGRRSYAWKGGKIKDAAGYIQLYKPEHPNAVIGRTHGYVHEHRFVMSEALGRPLLRTEQVHHRNGDRADNRLENLELWTTSQPAGQRVEEKLEWCKEFIKLYEKSKVPSLGQTKKKNR